LHAWAAGSTRMANLHWATSRIIFRLTMPITARTSLAGSASTPMRSGFSTPRSHGLSSTTNFEIADFLLAHGADINTNWCSHEPASMLHELVWYKNYQAMQFLIDRGIDMTIRDYRWGATAEGWARVAAKDEKLGQFPQDAQQRRDQTSH
jgi:hypothetical protein